MKQRNNLYIPLYVYGIFFFIQSDLLISQSAITHRSCTILVFFHLKLFVLVLRFHQATPI